MTCPAMFGRVWERLGEFGYFGRVWESFGRVWESLQFWIACDTDSEMLVFGKVFGRVRPNIEKSHFLRDFRYDFRRDWVTSEFILEEI